MARLTTIERMSLYLMFYSNYDPHDCKITHFFLHDHDKIDGIRKI